MGNLNIKLGTNIKLAKTKLLFFLFFIGISNYAQEVSVDIHLNVLHTIGTNSTFERSKFITIHANQLEKDWDGDNFTPDLRNDFLNGYDVYLGRDTGGITWILNNVEEDPTRLGFADPTDIASRGENSRNSFASQSKLHSYENRKNLVIAAQLHPFWTGESQKATTKGWKIASPTATGEYMGRYFNEFHGQNGQKQPAWVEVINEPAYEALGGKKDYTHSLQEIADFHVEVADAIRAQNSNLKIGGYTAAFPDFETGDFQRWMNRDKLFVDVAGEKMDFWSWHLYDFPAIGGKTDLRSGSNVEATFDMMDQYSMLKLGHTKPYVISEYGAQTHDYDRQGWTAMRDWLFLKVQNSLMMSFMERPDDITIAIPFTIVKAEWGYNHEKGYPYSARLMRKTNEPESYTGTWIYTDRVKFYQLWKNVKGKRIAIKATDFDIQVDAYVDGKKGYIILNSLESIPTQINLNFFDSYSTQISAIVKKHLTLSGVAPILEQENISPSTTNVVLGAESTMILEYTFENEITIDETSDEVKYFADDYLKPINASKASFFHINNVEKTGVFGEAVLRISIGREHGKQLIPTLKVNDKIIKVPEDWRGYDQADKGQFFGTLEIPVPYDLIKTNNEIFVEFPDFGGHISSTVMQVFNFSDDFSTLGVMESPIDRIKINLFPNPANKSFQVKLPTQYLGASFIMYNTSGVKLSQQVISKENTLI
ncbi:agarase [Aureibaculum algae]|uniref:Agarase n=1 Tax=Aureibaculum algae TaxID=2584122 RepID=A0A5B7TVR5_9FLAO|nr:agarase [Aureibaculum algae]QCX40348.1 agarase [Aureibaculum algae]